MEMTLGRLAAHINGEVRGDADKIIREAAPVDLAGPDAVAFADHPSVLKRLGNLRAGAVIVSNKITETIPANLVLVENPRLAFARIMHLFFPRTRLIKGISPAAAVGRHFSCGANVIIGAGAYIGEYVELGDGVTIHPNAYIGDHVKIGDETEIFPNVSILERCVIGRRVIIHSGTVVGSDGFGFTPDGEHHFKIPQVGIVCIDDDVEIGAGNTIDRATFGKTWIQRGVKTDNHVHIAHNVEVGEHTILVAQVGISGSVTVGKHVIMAGQAGIAGHLTIGDGATIGPQAGVARSVSAGQTVSGTPEMPHRQWLRVQQTLAKLPEMKKTIADLKKRLCQLEEQIQSSGEETAE